MSSFKQLKKTDVSVVPYVANKRWNFSYTSVPNDSFVVFSRGTNEPFNSNGSTTTNGQYQSLIYDLINHTFYQEYSESLSTGSLMFNINTYESASSQRPTSSYFIYNDNSRFVNNFPTASNSTISVLSINKNIFGSKILPNSFTITSSLGLIIDDGYGNLYESIVTGSQPSTNVQYTVHGIKLYSSGFNIDGTGTNISWSTVNDGGSYSGTFWANPVSASKTGRLNYTGLWSARSLTYFGSGTLTFTISAPTTGTYYFGIGCDNYASLYVDNVLILTQPFPDETQANFKYWHIYPISLTAGNHTIKFVGTNAGIPSINNPGSMGIEVYNNTSTQISASVATSPTGSSVPSGLNILYSSKDYLTSGNFDNQYYTNIGNIFYAHGIAIITNQSSSFQTLLTGSFASTASISFYNEHIIYENEIHCLVEESDYNLSYNPTLVTGSYTGSILRNFATASYFQPYVTTIGLYNDNNELLMVAKLGKPIVLSSETDMTFVVKYDL